MTVDAVTLIILAAVIAAFLQPNAPRFFAAVAFVGVTLTHELFFPTLDGLNYYGSAALMDLSIIAITSGISPVPKMVLTLQKICLVSILANLAGWILWTLYYPPAAYDAALLALYVWALVSLINRSGLDVGGYTVASWGTCFRFNRFAGLYNNYQHGGKV